MSDAAGSINVVLSVNKASFSAAMEDAQNQLNKFSGASKSAGHASVSSTQAASAALRVLQGDMTNNIRAVERFVGSIPGVGAALKAAFPIVGLVAFGGLIASLGTKVVDFLDRVNKMPKAIEMGFASMQLAALSSNDTLQLTNDKLQNAIDKIEHKPVNNLAIEFDEAAVAADKLATSIESSNNKIDSLLSQNHLSGLALLTGKMGTADREGTLKAFGDQANSNAYDLATAQSSGDTAGVAKSKAALAATQAAELANLRSDLSNRQANSKNPGALNDTANENIDKGAITAILTQQKQQAEEIRNASLTAEKQKLDDAKAAAEAAKAAAQQRVQAMTANLEQMKLQNNLSIKQVYDYWESMRSEFASGSAAYNAVVAKQTQAAVEGARAAHEAIAKSIASSKQGRIEDATTGPELINRSASFIRGQAVTSGREQTQGYLDSNQDAIDSAHNTAMEEQAKIMDQAGKSLTQYAAAQQIANVHTQEFVTIQEALQGILDARIAEDKANPTAQSARAVTAARAGLANANTQRTIQVSQDQQNINPVYGSAVIGAKDALNDFVNASRDAADMMRNLVTNTLSGLNNQIANGLTGGKTNFKQFGQGVARNALSSGLNKAEGSVLGAFGLGGKVGTKGNPMYVTMASSGTSGATSAISSLMPKTGIGGFFGSLLTSFIPHFAAGGSISGPALVGENGPEIFNPGTAGTIIPNNKLSLSGGGQNISYSVDARGTDPVQTEQRVRSAIVASHQSSVSQAVTQVHQQAARQPARSR